LQRGKGGAGFQPANPSSRDRQDACPTLFQFRVFRGLKSRVFSPVFIRVHLRPSAVQQFLM
jgi:hypothetical protein